MRHGCLKRQIKPSLPACSLGMRPSLLLGKNMTQPEPNAEIKVDIGGGKQRTMPVHYPANSKRSRVTPPKTDTPVKEVKKVTTGAVIQRNQSMFRRMIASLVSTESSQSVGEYLMLEVLIPAAKNMIVDTIEQAANRFFYGDSRPRGTTTGARPGYTSYNRIHSSAPLTTPGVRSISQRTRTNHEFSEVILETRGEAEDVIDGLRILIEQYEVATVADLYDLLGASGNFTDNQWGWYDLRSASVRHVRQGYLLVLPRTVQID